MSLQTVAGVTLADFDIEKLVRRSDGWAFSFEYNCDMRRVFPWPGMAETKRPITEFGVVWVEVAPGTKVERHDHDEEESFMIVSGQAELHIENQTTTLNVGDVVYVPRGFEHQMCNPGTEKLVFIDIYWDFKGRPREVVRREI